MSFASLLIAFAHDSQFFIDESTSAAVIYVRVNEICEFIITTIAGPLAASYVVFTPTSIAGAALIDYVRHGFAEMSKLYAYMPLKLK